MAGKKTARKGTPKPSSPVENEKTPEEHVASAVFPIVGVGASAGGVQAFTELVRHLPADPGLAIIFVLHTERHESELDEVVMRASKMQVRFAVNATVIERDHIYLLPPGAEVTVVAGMLRVEKKRQAPSLPIDLLFGSLANDQQGRAIGVVLSGAASDGALGSKAIKGEGGITFAQDDTAQFNDMPRAAIAAGAIDFVMSPDEIAHELVRIARHTYMIEPVAGRLDDEQLGEVFGILKASHDVDFTHYKPSTIERRIRRRMALHGVATLPEYVELLREDTSELEQLYGDLLIRVTGFFRDPEVFEALQRTILPSLMKDRREDAPIRVWVPGCATGEEVYSLAIALSESVHERGWTCPV
jgi:two-component system CheB/CheR fusion protein